MVQGLFFRLLSCFSKFLFEGLLCNSRDIEIIPAVLTFCPMCPIKMLSDTEVFPRLSMMSMPKSLQA